MNGSRREKQRRVATSATLLAPSTYRAGRRAKLRRPDRRRLPFDPDIAAGPLAIRQLRKRGAEHFYTLFRVPHPLGLRPPAPLLRSPRGQALCASGTRHGLCGDARLAYGPPFSCGREHLRRLSAVGSAGGGPEALEARLVQLPLSEDVTQSRAATLRASATSPGLKTHRTHT